MLIGRRRARRIGAAALWVGMATAACTAHAGGWLADKSGCQVWDANPRLNETVTWSGNCSNGHADGFGTVQWLQDNKVIETDNGEWRDGRQVGEGEQDWPLGRYQGELADGVPNGKGVLTSQKFRYQGQFRDGKPNGNGSLTGGDQTVEGAWKDGCLQGGQRKVSIGIPLSKCR